MWEVNVNMVYVDPLQKLVNVQQGSTRGQFLVLLVAKSYNTNGVNQLEFFSKMIIRHN